MKEQVEETIRLLYMSEEYKEFYNELDKITQNKVDIVINYIKNNRILSQNFVKKMKNSKNHQFEILVRSTNKREYRILSIGIDNENLIDANEILLLNGFLKKENKDYKSAMNKADTIIENFFDQD